MKRGLLILVIGLVLAITAYGCFFFVCTSSARSMQRSDKPELAWLKDEFNLSETEFKHVSDLHAAYLPQCQEMCRKIEAQNAQLQKSLAGATNVTPHIENALVEASRLRADCQTMMLRHFMQVSQTMPPEQGRRYLAWVKQKAFQPNYGMNEHR
jgi:hypothetical protein